MAKEAVSDDLYCYNVVQSNQALEVNNALTSAKWDSNPDIKLGMVAYYGVPLNLPNGENFGTFCILDDHEREFDQKVKDLIDLLRKSIEISLSLVHEFEEISLEKDKLSLEIEELDQFHSLTNLPTQFNANEYYSSKAHENLLILFIRNVQAYEIRDNLGLFDVQRFTKVFYSKVKSILPEGAALYYISNSEMILVHDVEQAELLEVTAQDLANAVQQVFAEPIQMNNKNIILPTGIGCALSYKNEFSFAEVLDMATVACTQGTKSGKHFHIFNPEQQKKHRRHYEVTQQFAYAFEHNEFYLNYQPIISGSDNQVVGCEALVRWKNEKLGMVFPDEFIPLSEKSGAILQLGDWILDEALSSLKRWQQEEDNKNFYISINISSNQLAQEDFSDQIIKKIRAFYVNPTCILLEFTETAFLGHGPLVLKHCQKLAEAGIRMALDDFGTGFSSLSHLHDFPINVVKIDKSFILNLDKSERSNQLVKGILSLGKLLDLTIVAEGVENQDVCEQLQHLRCDYWNRPMLQQDFEIQYLPSVKQNNIEK
ncbi:EAL domain-containing protein [Vibrio sp. S11_S32]|uniref:sensor domain-containing phosphodiesterase n=1 Tax=Vibrio sp. S11_S32 TaxID=2720225 RepID=UPI001680411E|nr:GGDEF domain-containing phosphodiesterase [Vibrio sp. S11_S32]MBD1576666.1 EAL domain-containing protein [Vibrio sp. S11_S32]